MRNKKITVAVALSGGVDSAATAYILKEQGYDVFGLTMKVCDTFDESSALYVAQKLEIPLCVIDFRQCFEAEVIDEFVKEYLMGKTPNPCIVCNMKIKYKRLLEEAKNLGADRMALGHYAKIKYEAKDDLYHLYKSGADRKDQSYYLYHLKQHQLASIMLPLAEYEDKKRVRELIKGVMPHVSEQKDSNDICFVHDMSHYQFIKKRTQAINSKGNFVDINGCFIGKHKGIYNYTIGQKRGLGLNGANSWSVVSINSTTNEIVLGNDEDTYRHEIMLKEISYINDEDHKIHKFNCCIKLCQWGYFIECTVINGMNKSARVEFLKPERAPSPGQAAVFYVGEEVMGGGIIV